MPKSGGYQIPIQGGLAVTETIAYTQGSEFIDALRRAGLTVEQIRLVTTHTSVAKAVVGLLADKAKLSWDSPSDSENLATTSLMQAKTIMGKNYHDPFEWVKTCNLRLTEAYSRIFAHVPINPDRLRLYSDTHILVPILNLNILQLHSRFPSFFYCNEVPWYESEAFLTEQIEPHWALVQREVITDSVGKRYSEQLELLLEGEEVLSAPELLQAIICHAVMSDERLITTTYARTSSIYTSGFRVYLGFYEDFGLTGSYDWDGNDSRLVGIVSSLKLC